MRRDVFQAIADPTRRDILNMITHKKLNLNSIAENFDMSRPAISQHIKLLEECGLIQINQEGRDRYCELQVNKLKEIDNWLEPFKHMWESRFEQLDDLLTEMKNITNKRK